MAETAFEVISRWRVTSMSSKLGVRGLDGGARAERVPGCRTSVSPQTEHSWRVLT